MRLALHHDTSSNHKRVKLFWTAFTGMFVYEILPSYIFPLLNGVNIVCLATQNASAKTVDIVTNLFGGIDGNEGKQKLPAALSVLCLFFAQALGKQGRICI